MKKRIAILANHSGGLYDFRKDLISELKKHANVTVAVPHNDRWEELQKLVDEVIELPVDRRGRNPIHDSKLFRQYRAMLKEVKPDLVLTYTIKPNIYGGLACRMAHIPYAVNITGLGSAIDQRDRQTVMRDSSSTNRIRPIEIFLRLYDKLMLRYLFCGIPEKQR